VEQVSIMPVLARLNFADSCGTANSNYDSQLDGVALK